MSFASLMRKARMKRSLRKRAHRQSYFEAADVAPVPARHGLRWLFSDLPSAFRRADDVPPAWRLNAPPAEDDG